MANLHYEIEFDEKDARKNVRTARKYAGSSIGEARRYAFFEILSNHHLTVDRIMKGTAVFIFKVNEDQFRMDKSKTLLEVFVGDKFGNLKSVTKMGSHDFYAYSPITGKLTKIKK